MDNMTTFYAIEAVMADNELTTSVKAICQNLLFYITFYGKCYPSVKTIAEDTGYSISAVHKATRLLQDKGYILKVERKEMKKQYSNEYYFCLNEAEIKKKKTCLMDREMLDHICFDRDFQDFIGKGVFFNHPYKWRSIYYVIKKIKTRKYDDGKASEGIGKKEKLLLLYALLCADKEAFFYFEIDKLQNKLGLCRKRLMQVIRALKKNGFLSYIRKQIKGREIVLMQINIKMLNKEAVLQNKLEEIRKKKIRKNKNINKKVKNKYFLVLLICLWMILKTSFQIFTVRIFHLTVKFLHPNKTMVIKKTKDRVIEKNNDIYFRYLRYIEGEVRRCVKTK